MYYHQGVKTANIEAMKCYVFKMLLPIVLLTLFLKMWICKLASTLGVSLLGSVVATALKTHSNGKSLGLLTPCYESYHGVLYGEYSHIEALKIMHGKISYSFCIKQHFWFTTSLAIQLKLCMDVSESLNTEKKPASSLLLDHVSCNWLVVVCIADASVSLDLMKLDVCMCVSLCVYLLSSQGGQMNCLAWGPKITSFNPTARQRKRVREIERESRAWSLCIRSPTSHYTMSWDWGLAS